MSARPRPPRCAGLLLSLLAPAAPALADFCLAPADEVMDRLLLEQDAAEDELTISADRADVVRDGVSSLEGNVELRSHGRALSAERAEFDSLSRRLRVSGAVEYVDGNLRVRGEDADFDGDEQRVRFDEAGFSLPRRPARGGADALEVRADRTVRLTDVFYTTCPEGSRDWVLSASNVHLDVDSGFGTARSVRVDFMGFPLLYTPWITFPITDERKTGFLFPQFGRSNRTGEDVSIPYYLNLAPNYDATLTPRIMTRRGLMLGTEFRYLSGRSQGIARLDYLPGDRAADRDRRYASLSHTSMLGRRWRMTLDGEDVSDSEYLEDLVGTGSTASLTHLDRRLEVEYAGDDLRFLARFQDHQTLDRAIEDIDQPYRRLPQLLVDGSWPDRWLGMDLQLGAEVVNFDRDTGVTGWRVDTMPELSRRFGPPGLYLRPAVALQHTRYLLDEHTDAPQRRPERTVPLYSADAGAQLERSLAGGRLLQTLEPRVQYAYVPYRDQGALPVFDTIVPDFDLVQLFRVNRYLGADRVQDTEQVSLGVTTRVLDERDGRERLRVTLGQTRYLADQQVALPGESPPSKNSAEYVGELALRLADSWRLNLGHQWNSDLAATTRAEAGLRFSPPDDSRVVNLAYRFRKGSLEQTDVAFSWPAGERWNVVGRYNYSWREGTTLDRFAGLEYEACCFAARVVLRRHISRRTGESDTTVALQIELKGLASVGDSISHFLERGVLGYDR